ncbi:MAG: trimethylamine methyltransferase family protein [Actinobacteria bacterium]|nr:trimethylamine methyltransferase family protein [Actinomycetota bacterium]
MFRNDMPYYEIISPEGLETIERGWKRLVSEIGIEFLHEEALELFRAAGQKVEDSVVHLDPEFVLEMVAKAPSEFHLRARNPEHSVVLGGRNMVFPCVSGPPFFRTGDERRDGTLSDYELMAKLVQSFPQLDMATMPMIEPNDRPLDSRHLDMLYASFTLTDKPIFGSALSNANALDSIEAARIVHRGHDLFVPAGDDGRPTTSIMTIVNVNSPLRYDDRMLEALLRYAEAGQGVVVTPFLLMGAMAPVSTVSALAQQTAESLAGIALMQLVRPGTPAVMGSFLSTTDMQSGSPAFGGPESAKGLYASGQIARRYGLPWRAGGGGLPSSQTLDAQAAYEAFNTLLAAFQAGANLVVQSAGWLESGLVSSPDKLVMDVELLRVLREQFSPLVVDEDALAFEAHDEVRHGGHFLGAAHTMTRFRTCFYRPMLSSTENFERWVSKGGRDTATRAGEIWRDVVEKYELPAMDASVHDELLAFVNRRRTELGD